MHPNEHHHHEDNTNETDSEGENLSSHTLSMRKAVQKCLDTLLHLFPDGDVGSDKKTNYEIESVGSKDGSSEEGWSKKIKRISSAAKKAEFEDQVQRHWLQLFKAYHHDGASSQEGKRSDKNGSHVKNYQGKKKSESNNNRNDEIYLFQYLRDSALEEATLLHSRRCDSVVQFWNDYNNNVSDLSVDEKGNFDEGKDSNVHPIDTVHIQDKTDGKEKYDQDEYAPNGDSTNSNNVNQVLHLTPLEFKKRYVYRNIPCIIRGMDQTNFRDVTTLWRKKARSNVASPGLDCDNNAIINSDIDDDITNEIDCDINVEWFREHVGKDEMVPVRKAPTSTTENEENDNHNDDNDYGLDEDGRAVECETIHLTMSNWIEQSLNKNMTMDPTMYLKDWHLMQFLEQKQQQTAQLYKVPRAFQHDLLNAFLMKFTNGDYRFVYWGPVNSYTGPHTDVLHSFSWSYNVAGEKLWTFYPPSSIDSKPFQFTQQPGETIFVPSLWKHDVRNVRHNTLSINHNWITTANIDLVWDCIVAEVHAVEKEMKAWWGETETSNGAASDDMDTKMREDGYNVDHYEARENMVRGCCGLDVTSFLLMVMTSMVDCLDTLFDLSDQYCIVDNLGVVDEFGKCSDMSLQSREKKLMVSQTNMISEISTIKETKMTSRSKDEVWERFFSLFRLQNLLRQIVGEQNSSMKSTCGESQGNKNGKVDGQQLDCPVEIHVKRRLRAVLMSDEYALHTVEMSFLIMQIVDILKSS